MSELLCCSRCVFREFCNEWQSGLKQVGEVYRAEDSIPAATHRLTPEIPDSSNEGLFCCTLCTLCILLPSAVPSKLDLLACFAHINMPTAFSHPKSLLMFTDSFMDHNSKHSFGFSFPLSLLRHLHPSFL
jgi:hypothetical protein